MESVGMAMGTERQAEGSGETGPAQSSGFVPRSKHVHVGELVNAVLGASGMTKAELGRRIYTSRQNVNTLLRKESWTTDTLSTVSIALGVDLFAQCGARLGFEEKGRHQLAEMELREKVLELVRDTVAFLERLVVSLKE